MADPIVNDAPAPTLSRSALIRGHVALWLFALAILLFKVWDWYMDLPHDDTIRLVGGLLDPRVGQLSAFFNFLLGWLGLTALVSLANLKWIFIEFFRPLNLIEDYNLKRFFAAPATLAFAILTLVASTFIATSVWLVTLQARYEILADLSASPQALLGAPDKKGELTLRVASDDPIRIRLGPPGSSAVLIMRDKYNLRTLDAIVLRRTPIGFEALPCSLKTLSPLQAQDRGALSGLQFPGPREIEVRDPLRWSGERVQTPLVLADGIEKRGGWVRAGDGKDGPERAPQPYAQQYLERLFTERERMEEWEDSPAYVDQADQPMALHAVEGYDLRITYNSGELRCPGNGPLWTREATELHATVHKDTSNEGGA